MNNHHQHEENDMTQRGNENGLYMGPMTADERATAQARIPKAEAELTTFKFRCEFPHDAAEFYRVANEHIYTMTIEADHKVPGGLDPEVTVEVGGISLDELRTIMATIVDGHVMVETIELVENYTGDRKYKLVQEIIAADNEQPLEEESQPESA